MFKRIHPLSPVPASLRSGWWHLLFVVLDSISVNLGRTTFFHTTLPHLSAGTLIKLYAVIGLFCLILTSWSCIMLKAIAHLFIPHPQIQDRKNYAEDGSFSIIHQDAPVSKDNPRAALRRPLLALGSSLQRPPPSLDTERGCEPERCLGTSVTPRPPAEHG